MSVNKTQPVMFPIQEVSPIDIAFGGSPINKLLPPYAEIPAEIKRGGTWGHKLFSDWFYCGVQSLKLEPREGVDTKKALNHIKAIIGSFEPKHEHKEDGIAYLLDQWFKSGTWERAKSKEELVR